MLNLQGLLKSSKDIVTSFSNYTLKHMKEPLTYFGLPEQNTRSVRLDLLKWNFLFAMSENHFFDFLDLSLSC